MRSRAADERALNAAIGGSSSRRPSAAAWSAAAITGILLYAAIDVALVFLRPGFSVLHNAESDYGSKGAYAWLMDLNFVLRGLLGLAVVRALAIVVRDSGRLRAGMAFLALWSVASGLLAFFPDDPVGTTTRGLAKVHVVMAGIAFLAVVVGTRLVTRALRSEAVWQPIVAPLSFLSWGALLPILLLGRAHLHPHSLGGLYEKIFLAIELLWFFVVAAWVVRCNRTTEPEEHPPTASATRGNASADG